LTARDLVHQDAVELGEDGDMTEYLVLAPLGFAVARLDLKAQLSQAR